VGDTDTRRETHKLRARETHTYRVRA